MAHAAAPVPQKPSEYIKKYILLVVGAFLYAFGLENFLVPNSIIDGGVVGIALMAAEVSGISFSIWFVAINLPFVYLGWKRLGWRFAVASIFSVVAMSLWSEFFHTPILITRDPFLSAIFGGIIAGIGCGLIIRYGGSLDGTEIVAIIAERSVTFTVGELILFMNLFILGTAGLIFGWDSAMYSLVTYFVISKLIDIVITGFDETFAVFIITNNHEAVGQALLAMGRGITLLHGKGGYLGDDKEIIYCVVSRLELDNLKTIVNETDPSAFLTINAVHDFVGGRFSK